MADRCVFHFKRAIPARGTFDCAEGRYVILITYCPPVPSLRFILRDSSSLLCVALAIFHECSPLLPFPRYNFLLFPPFLRAAPHTLTIIPSFSLAFLHALSPFSHAAFCTVRVRSRAHHCRLSLSLSLSVFLSRFPISIAPFRAFSSTFQRVLTSDFPSHRSTLF